MWDRLPEDSCSTPPITCPICLMVIYLSHWSWSDISYKGSYSPVLKEFLVWLVRREREREKVLWILAEDRTVLFCSYWNLFLWLPAQGSVWSSRLLNWGTSMESRRQKKFSGKEAGQGQRWPAFQGGTCRPMLRHFPKAPFHGYSTCQQGLCF